MPLLKLRHASGRPRPRKGQLSFRRIDACNLGGGAAIDEQFGKSAIAATDVDPSQGRRRRQPIEKNLAGAAAPLSHHLFVSGSIVETKLRLSHLHLPMVAAAWLRGIAMPLPR